MAALFRPLLNAHYFLSLCIDLKQRVQMVTFFGFPST